jgi:hypothetical protein
MRASDRRILRRASSYFFENFKDQESITDDLGTVFVLQSVRTDLGKVSIKVSTKTKIVPGDVIKFKGIQTIVDSDSYYTTNEWYTATLTHKFQRG